MKMKTVRDRPRFPQRPERVSKLPYNLGRIQIVILVDYLSEVVFQIHNLGLKAHEIQHIEVSKSSKDCISATMYSHDSGQASVAGPSNRIH